MRRTDGKGRAHMGGRHFCQLCILRDISLSQVSLPGLCKPYKQQLLLYLQILARTVPIPSRSNVLSGTFRLAPVQHLATAKILSLTSRLGSEILVESSRAAPTAAAAPSPSKGLYSSKIPLGRSLSLSALPPLSTPRS